MKIESTRERNEKLKILDDPKTIEVTSKIHAILEQIDESSRTVILDYIVELFRKKP